MSNLFENNPTEVELYPIQEHILNELRNTIRYNKRTVLMAGTGLGKTQIAIQIIKQALKKEKRCCFVCHRINLVEQTSRAFYLQGIHHGVIQGNHPDYFPHRPVQVCSVQTLAKRDQYDFDIYFFDEIQVFFKTHKQILKNNPDAFFIGLSATPFTPGLGQYFTALCHPVPIKELIQKKILKRFDIYGPNTIDLTGVRTVAGDYKKDDLEKAVDKPKLTADIVDTWLRLARDRKTIVFSSGVGHSRHLEKEFLKRGIKAKEINGYMRKENTEYDIGANQIIEDFRNNEFQVIISVEMLVAGFDVTDVSCVVFATSTKSIMKFCQGVGRGLRKHEGLEDCLVLDHGGITERLGFPDEFEFIQLDDGKHAESKNKQQEKPEQLPKACPSCDFIKPAGVQKCPACGFKPEFVKDVEVSEGELKKLQRKAKKEYSLEEKQSWLSQFNQYAFEKGYRAGKDNCYGWSIHKYADKFGGDPPSRIQWNLKEPVTQEVRKFILHLQIKYAKSKDKIVLKSIPDEMPLKEACEKCRCSTGLLSESGPHIKVTCAGCNAYIKFAKKEDIARGKTI